MIIGRLPAPRGLPTARVERAWRFYRRAASSAISTAELLAEDERAMQRRRQRLALLCVELDSMTRAELAQYYAGIRKS